MSQRTLQDPRSHYVLRAFGWLVLPQGTFTPLVHAHAGRTQGVGADGTEVIGERSSLSAAAQLHRYAAIGTQFRSIAM